ncbi:PQQ-dependent sugar dehydrogenase [Streptomyces sp. NPDC002680]|uniref:PQQ-dependent sugar dehydrogenase n=1 Tax=Streptomyces sp. NPDC002680 TaxID=3364659 RepID=UPI0036C7DABF
MSRPPSPHCPLDARRRDRAGHRINLIKPGANYGRPIREGSCGVAGMTDPKATWGVAEASPSGIAIVRNVVYMASLRGQRLWRIPIDGDSENVGTPTAYYVWAYGRLRTVTKVPGADQLWLSTTNSDNNGGEPDGSDRILRVDIGQGRKGVRPGTGPRPPSRTRSRSPCASA